MKRFLVFVMVVALSLVAPGMVLAQQNPFLGTWKLDIAKSKYVNSQAPRNETRTVKAQGDGTWYSFEGVAADGNRIAYSYTTNSDGKDSPYSGVGTPNGADTNALKRIDANTTTSTAKKAGKVVQTTRSVVSKDGKVTTITVKGTNGQGQPTSATLVFEKQ